MEERVKRASHVIYVSKGSKTEGRKRSRKVEGAAVQDETGRKETGERVR
jgi:hypothetical protein